MLSVLPAASRFTYCGSMPGSGTLTFHPSSVASTWKPPAALAVRVGRSFQNWLNTRSISRWKLKMSSNGLERVRPNIPYLLKDQHDLFATCLWCRQADCALDSKIFAAAEAKMRAGAG